MLIATLAIGQWSPSVAVALDITPPTIVSTNPANAATGVTVDHSVAVTFSEAMDPASITPTSVMLQLEGISVAAAVGYSSATRTAILQPSADLAPNTTYVAIVTTGVRDLALNPLQSQYNFFFTTTSDTTIPTVTSESPANGATGVPINGRIFVRFSEPMNPATVTAATFTLANGAVPVPGIVTCVGATASFVPTGALSPSATFTATVSTGAKDLGGHALASPVSWTFSTGTGPDTTRPTVTSTVPAAGATGVSPSAPIVATFDEEMDPLSINTGTFTLRQGATVPVSGTVTSTSRTAIFTPAVSLSANTSYTAILVTAVDDASGNSLLNNVQWAFVTGNSTAPTVVATNPANHATGVAVGQAITATFSQPMNPTALTTATFTLRHGSTPVRGRVTLSTSTLVATFLPAIDLATSTTFTATIAAGVTDLAGDPLASDFVWSFVTGTNQPTVVSTNPASGATGVFLNQKITATFNKAINPATITSSTFTLKHGATPVRGSLIYSTATLTATFAPLGMLLSDSVYSADVTVGVKDLAGNPLASDHTWSFTTGNVVPNPGAGAVITYRGCKIVEDPNTPFALIVTEANNATIRITSATIATAQAAPGASSRVHTLVLPDCAEIPSIVAHGNVAAIYTQLPVDVLTVTGELGSAASVRSVFGKITAGRIDSISMVGAADSFNVLGGDSGTSGTGTYAATSIYSGGRYTKSLSISLIGVVLEDLVTSQSISSLSVSSRVVPKRLTGGVPHVISVGGIGKVIPSGAVGSTATDFRLQAQGVIKVKASGASVLPDTLDSTRNNLLQLVATEQVFRIGHKYGNVGGLVGVVDDSMKVQAPNMGLIRGDTGVHGTFIAGTSTTNHPGFIIEFATKGRSNSTTGTTPISGDCYVGDFLPFFTPNGGTMQVHSSGGTTTATLALSPDSEPAALKQ